MRDTNFQVGDRVECSYVGREITSKHVRHGDRGEIKKIKHEDPDVTVYMVDFDTVEGYRRQWVYAHSISKIEERITVNKEIINDIWARLLENQSNLDDVKDKLNDLSTR